MNNLNGTAIGIKIAGLILAIGLLVLYTVIGYYLYGEIAVNIFDLPKLTVWQYYKFSWLLYITLNPAKMHLKINNNKEEDIC